MTPDELARRSGSWRRSPRFDRCGRRGVARRTRGETGWISAVSYGARCGREATRSSGRTARARVVPRRLVVLCDVSGSMEAYTRPLLVFLHAVRGSGRWVEAFAFGTRLTRLTEALGRAGPRRRCGRRPWAPSTGAVEPGSAPRSRS